MKDFNFIHRHCDMEIASMLLDGWPAVKGWHPVATGFNFKFIQDGWTMANIAVEIGLFPSVTQARKNGWADPIPPGFFMKTLKKQGIILCIVNISQDTWNNRHMLQED